MRGYDTVPCRIMSNIFAPCTCRTCHECVLHAYSRKLTFNTDGEEQWPQI